MMPKGAVGRLATPRKNQEIWTNQLKINYCSSTVCIMKVIYVVTDHFDQEG